MGRYRIFSYTALYVLDGLVDPERESKPDGLQIVPVVPFALSTRAGIPEDDGTLFVPPPAETAPEN